MLEGIVTDRRVFGGGGGYTVGITHSNEYRSLYMHLGVDRGHTRRDEFGDGFRVEIREIVATGQLIGLSGNSTGNNTVAGYHLHLEIRSPYTGNDTRGEPINPLAFYHWDDSRTHNDNPIFILVDGRFVFNENFIWSVPLN